MNQAIETPIEHRCVAQRQLLVTVWNEEYPDNLTHAALFSNAQVLAVKQRLQNEYMNVDRDGVIQISMDSKIY